MALARRILTIIAALRYYQRDLRTTTLPGHIVDLATDRGDAQPLSTEEIDALCDYLEAQPWTLLRALGDYQHD